MFIKVLVLKALLLISFSITSAFGSPIYLNNTNISVSVGAGTSSGSFNNTFSGGNTIDKVIDAPSATATEFHNQSTHIWFTAGNVGGGLELLFNFGQEYDISTLHFWNYTGEGFDVDNIDFTFFNSSNVQVGTLGIQPALGSSPGILAQDIVLPAPLNVQFVTAFLTGTNRQVDFQNIGFTAKVSTPMPEPGLISLLALGLLGMFVSRRRLRNRS
ncbi:PEP-CTERM protein-sorting domain-containing protein [Nitrosomonas sp. Nm51]|uniref:PEP-CTERM sorting domain-containing protein n=1 Tax=Nitrosomonas sp. Nm51 TaxID=133720 RepID=UPI0008AECFBB|nr:PEP-CTERM sorting domain-containing protein [Nitrosomonas sp. Nm51]SER18528.1 PEP-CTERM protein-sorting domain-containing protein [Nitrosomonas sp. Nm51]